MWNFDSLAPTPFPAAVINVGTATLGALIGAGGYGQPILADIRLDDANLILQGAILALMVQGGFGLFERRLLSHGISDKASTKLMETVS